MPGSISVDNVLHPPLYEDKKFLVLSDWDGTITTFDSNDYMIDVHGFGQELRRQGDLDVLHGKMGFRDSFKIMVESVSAKLSFEECKAIMKKEIAIDPSFKAFYEWCQIADIPLIIVSSGMEHLIRAVLSEQIGEEQARQVDIVANAVELENKPEDVNWTIRYRHPESPYGHDKSRMILPYRSLLNPPTIFFFGDGVSDISAAKHADVLFVKVKPNADNDLAVYCVTENIKHICFEGFSSAFEIVKKVVDGRMSLEETLALGRV